MFFFANSGDSRTDQIFWNNSEQRVIQENGVTVIYLTVRSWKKYINYEEELNPGRIFFWNSALFF